MATSGPPHASAALLNLYFFFRSRGPCLRVAPCERCEALLSFGEPLGGGGLPWPVRAFDSAPTRHGPAARVLPRERRRHYILPLRVTRGASVVPDVSLRTARGPLSCALPCACLDERHPSRDTRVASQDTTLFVREISVVDESTPECERGDGRRTQNIIKKCYVRFSSIST